MTGPLIALAVALLVRLGLLCRAAPADSLDVRPVPRPVQPALVAAPAISLGLPGNWTPMTGSEP